jgi:hypothetical protein
MASELRQRHTTKVEDPQAAVEVGHPGGEIKHGGAVQILRLLLVTVYFFSSCCT